jgi:hypothetical protein
VNDEDLVLEDLETDAPWGDDEVETPISGLPVAVRRALVKLLTTKFITGKDKATWNVVLRYEDEIRERLADLFMVLVIDKRLEVAFKRQDTHADGMKILKQGQGHELSQDASFLLIHLRRECVFTDGDVQITKEEVTEFLRAFGRPSGGDKAGREARTERAIRALIDLRLLTVVAGADYMYQVSPVIEALVGSDELQRFDKYFHEQSGSAEAELEDEGGEE